VVFEKVCAVEKDDLKNLARQKEQKKEEKCHEFSR
jgi:hypothetical protein